MAKENSVVDILGKKERSFDVRRIDKAALYSNIIVLIINALIQSLKGINVMISRHSKSWSI